MTAINQSSTSSTVNIVAGDELFINDDVDVVTTSGAGVSATGVGSADIFNFGTVFAITGTGIDWLAGAGNIYNAGLIGSGSSNNIAIEFRADYVTSLLTITNASTGLIAGQVRIDEFGVSSSSPETGAVRVLNNGEINVPGSPFPSNTHYGVYVDGAFDSTVINTGTIIADEGIFARSQGSDNNVPIVRNSGIIEARIFDGIDYQNASTTTPGLIENSGTVTSATDNAIETTGQVVVRNTATGLVQGDVALSVLDAEGTHRLWNAGTILGDISTTGRVTVINRGDIDGDLSLGSGDDMFKGFGGTVTGTIDAGSGNDTLSVDQVDAVIDGGADYDVLYARSDVLDAINVEEIILQGAGNFEAFGDATTLRMNGNNGNNALFGGEAATITLAGAGNDVVEGFAGNDTMRGNGGDDALNGGADNDVIFGGTGDDTITGGRGRDILYGNQGADVFVYEDVLDSAASADRDIIVGFERGRDEIDVSAINDNAFSFVGTGGFSGGGGMELGYRVVAGGTQVVVEMDENGDGLVDAEIRVRGVGELSADDFVL